jgi:DNA polymerase III subunit delta'
MLFNKILGQNHIINHLKETANKGRIPHAQLFVGPEGSGVLATAIAYAEYILLQNNSNKEACSLKCSKFIHPDIHFIFPTATNDEVKTKPKSADFTKEWAGFLSQNWYGSMMDWFNYLGIDKKQGEIRVDDAQDIVKKLSLKSYEGGYKIMIIWLAEKMNIGASNKLLKILEEPTDETLFILVSESEEDIINTIKSRCQVLHFMGLPESVIAKELEEKHQIESKKALKNAHRAQGNFNKALKYSTESDDEIPFEKWFVKWVRTAFKAKGNAAAIHELINWSEEIASIGRENQKRFLYFCTDMFRQALLSNYNAKQLVYFEAQAEQFDIEKFAPFVNGNNIQEIFEKLSEAMYQIERNGNPKIIFTDLSIKLTRLIHKK